MKPKAKPSRAAVARQLAERVRDSTRDGAEIVEHLLRIMRDDDVAASDRIKAATTLLDRGYGRATEHVTISAGDQAESAVARMADAALEALLAGMRTVEGEIVRPGTHEGAKILPPNHQISEGIHQISEGLRSSGPTDAEIVAPDPMEEVALNSSREARPGTQDPAPPFRLTPNQSEAESALGREGPSGRQNPSRSLSHALDQDRDGQGTNGAGGGGADRAGSGGAGRAVERARGSVGYQPLPNPAWPAGGPKIKSDPENESSKFLTFSS